jgi:hypothetical protein
MEFGEFVQKIIYIPIRIKNKGLADLIVNNDPIAQE